MFRFYISEAQKQSVIIPAVNILGAHIDSPRLDLKQNPLYEAGDMAYLDTHYYGGVKAYHWVATPLALHGVICKKDGTTVDIAVGEDPADPVFCTRGRFRIAGQIATQEKGIEKGRISG